MSHMGCVEGQSPRVEIPSGPFIQLENMEGEKMTLLERIHTALAELEGNKKISVVKREDSGVDAACFESHSIPVDGAYWVSKIHDICYHIAPKPGLYTAGELRVFMEMLFSGIEPKTAVLPRANHKMFHAGWYIFEEIIAVADVDVTRTITCIDATVQQEENPQRISWKAQQRYGRSIMVKVYPCVHAAKAMLEGEFGADEYRDVFDDESLCIRYANEIPMEKLMQFQAQERREANTLLALMDAHGQQGAKPKKPGFFARIFGASS